MINKGRHILNLKPFLGKGVKKRLRSNKTLLKYIGDDGLLSIEQEPTDDENKLKISLIRSTNRDKLNGGYIIEPENVESIFIFVIKSKICKYEISWEKNEKMKMEVLENGKIIK